MIIPHLLLNTAILQNLIEDFVSRDGTDNGDDTPLSVRVERVKYALERKQAFIVYDQKSEACSLLLKQDIPQEWLDEL
ncbi:YheU family protein [Entomomonas moraniae]|uniref:YheU family protein n=1 Tax=Entomomonas moraniae TaxID=2213226 RepID=A0A3Q9JKN7_9GAMM|nr:YheU family protein [Entomomonas moraniae]AZS51825.1 YheU family protein [Entomomonas moraniae]